MNRTVLVTGSTVLIGSALVRHFSVAGCNVIAAARNVDKARSMFVGLPNVKIVEWDVLNPLGTSMEVDLMVHAASETASRSFVERPVETIRSVLEGTRNVLEAARTAKVKSMVFLSTMEVYGAPLTEDVSERDYGYLDPLSVRSCYPEDKRMAENLCVSYASEYGVPVKIARLTQTFGEGVLYNDGRVFAEFARAIIEKRDIVLKTDGSTARCYCYLGDAVEAIRLILEGGEVGTAYTVANEETFCTIREMAEMLVAAHPESGSKVVFDFSGSATRGFAPHFRMKLNCSRLKSLGWKPKVGLMDMFDRMMKDMEAT